MFEHSECQIMNTPWVANDNYKLWILCCISNLLCVLLISDWRLYLNTSPFLNIHSWNRSMTMIVISRYLDHVFFVHANAIWRPLLMAKRLYSLSCCLIKQMYQDCCSMVTFWCGAKEKLYRQESETQRPMEDRRIYDKYLSELRM